MAVTTAIIGGSVLGAGASLAASGKQSKAIKDGTESAASAQLESTRLQIQEIRRQFDTQMQILSPLVQNQYGAQSAFAQLLGFNNFNPETGQFDGAGFQLGQGLDGFFDPNLNPRQFGRDDFTDSELGHHATRNLLAAPEGRDDPAIRRARDLRLYTGVEDDSLYTHVRNNQAAGGSLFNDPAYMNVLNHLTAGDPGSDIYLNRTDDVRLAAPTLQEDERFRFAQDTATVGDEFETSPGYNFMIEEGQREVDRKNSAGGNYGGRALQEAQRRIQGIAQQDYYNWLGARHADLNRQDAAASAFQGRQAFDITRGDQATENYLQRLMFDAGRFDDATNNYLSRMLFDITRGDQAVGDARRREELDLARGDAALDSFFRRRGVDLDRQERAITNNQAQGRFDLSRQDQSYYNMLNYLASAAGFGNHAGAAVNAAGNAGSQIAGAYGNQGNALSSLYANQGGNLASVYGQGFAGANNALQGGLNNLLFHNYYQGLLGGGG